MAKARKAPLDGPTDNSAADTAAGSSVRPKRASRPTAKAQSAEVPRSTKSKKAGRPKKGETVQDALLTIDGTFLFFLCDTSN